MISTVISAFVDILSDAGINTRTSFPDIPLLPDDPPILCVGIRNCKLISPAMGDYLGVSENTDSGITELFGFRLELTVAIDIFASYNNPFGSAACVNTFSNLASALDNAPSGLRIIELTCGDVVPDHASELLHCPASASCSAFLIAQSEPDSNIFSDFILKGVINHGRQ